MAEVPLVNSRGIRSFPSKEELRRSIEEHFNSGRIKVIFGDSNELPEVIKWLGNQINQNVLAKVEIVANSTAPQAENELPNRRCIVTLNGTQSVTRMRALFSQIQFSDSELNLLVLLVANHEGAHCQQKKNDLHKSQILKESVSDVIAIRYLLEDARKIGEESETRECLKSIAKKFIAQRFEKKGDVLLAIRGYIMQGVLEADLNNTIDHNKLVLNTAKSVTKNLATGGNFSELYNAIISDDQKKLEQILRNQ